MRPLSLFLTKVTISLISFVDGRSSLILSSASLVLREER